MQYLYDCNINLLWIWRKCNDIKFVIQDFILLQSRKCKKKLCLSLERNSLSKSKPLYYFIHRFDLVFRGFMEGAKNVCLDDLTKVWIWKKMLANANNGRSRLFDGKIGEIWKQAIWYSGHLKCISVQRYLFPSVWQEVWVRRFHIQAFDNFAAQSFHHNKCIISGRHFSCPPIFADV